ncbi:hypothetical protein BJX99DRAFT_265214 [Aspergillus californicus]
MADSLRLGRHQAVNESKSPSAKFQSPDIKEGYDICAKSNHGSRSAGAHFTAPSQRMALDVASPPKLATAEAQGSQHRLSEPPHEYRTRDKLMNASDVGSNEQTAQPQKPDYVRPFTNPPNAINHMRGLDELGRRRARSIGSGPRDSRIAALSVQLRTRLSYAAARVEKSRQAHTLHHQSPTGLLQSNASTPILSAEHFRVGQLVPMGELEDQRSISNGSPDGTTVSAPDASATSSPHPAEAHMRPFPASTADGLHAPSQTNMQSSYRIPSSRESASPRLAPPVDFVSGRIDGQRRRPNPNIHANSSRYAPFSRHRRHRSQQETVMDRDVVLVPETPPLRPNALGPYSGLTDNSQSSSMEQDAIETLLFMSSPGASGYHSNSQNSQRNQDTSNMDSITSGNTQWPRNHVRGRANSRPPGQSRNLESRAGDDIDLMLDQMDSDSDDDAKYTSSHPVTAQFDSRANVHPALHET